MKNALTRWTFGAAFGLIVSAAGISIATEQAWAESCSGTTIAHGSADCLTAVFQTGRQGLSLTNECSGLGVVTAEIRVINYGSEGTVISLQALNSSEAVVEIIANDEDAKYTNARCCPTSGICDITDCDTTNGVIDDSSHATHCRHIDDTTGAVIRAGTEITNGVVTYTPPSDQGS